MNLPLNTVLMPEIASRKTRGLSGTDTTTLRYYSVLWTIKFEQYLWLTRKRILWKRVKINKKPGIVIEQFLTFLQAVSSTISEKVWTRLRVNYD